MKSRERRLWPVLCACGIAAGLAATAMVLTGCDKKDQASKPAAPPPPRPAPAVTAQAPEEVESIDVAAMLTSLQADARVQFPQERACADRSLAESVIKLSTGFAKGDDGAVGVLLNDEAKAVLEQLVGGGDWETATSRIEAVRVVRLIQDPEAGAASSATLQLAIQEPGESYVLAWAGAKAGETWSFSAAPAPDGTRPRSDWDGGVSPQAALPPAAPKKTSDTPPDASEEEPAPVEQPQTQTPPTKRPTSTPR